MTVVQWVSGCVGSPPPPLTNDSRGVGNLDFESTIVLFWRPFLFGDYFCLATISVWRPFLFGDYSHLAIIFIWRPFLFGAHFCLATILSLTENCF